MLYPQDAQCTVKEEEHQLPKDSGIESVPPVHTELVAKSAHKKKYKHMLL